MSKLLIGLLLSLVTPSVAFAQITEQDKALYPTRQLLKNGGFEAGKTNWTASGGTFATTTTTPAAGAAHATWDSSAASQTLTSTAVAIPPTSYGKNGLAVCSMKCASGSCTHKIQAYDGSNILGETSITSSTTMYARSAVYFPIPTSGNLSLRLISVASDEPSVSVDECYLGENYLLGNVSQAQFVGSIEWVGTSNCEWTRTGTSLGAFSSDTDCDDNARVVTGSLVDSSSGQRPEFQITNMKPGYYTMRITGQIGVTATTDTGARGVFAWYDGTNYSDAMEVGYDDSAGNATRAVDVGSVEAGFLYTTPGTRTFALHGRGRSGANQGVRVFSDGVTGVRIEVLYFPSSSDAIVRTDANNWRVDANISGSNPSLGTSTLSSYTGIEDASLTLTNNSGNSVIAAQIPCSSTNPPTGTTCAAGNESVGVSFTPPGGYTGDIRACVSFAHGLDTQVSASDPTISDTFQIVETAANSQTILQEGKSRLQSGVAQGGASGTKIQKDVPFTLCGTFTITSGGQKTLRLFYEQSYNNLGTINTNIIRADASGATGQRDIHWEVYPINQNMPVPVLVGGLKGTTTNDNPAAGYIGEVLESVEGTPTNVPGATTAFATSHCTVSFTAGDWMIGGQANFTLNGSTTQAVRACVSTGSSCTTNGDDLMNSAPPTSATQAGVTITPKRFSLSATTAVNINVAAQYSAGTPQYQCRLTGWRIR